MGGQLRGRQPEAPHSLCRAVRGPTLPSCTAPPSLFSAHGLCLLGLFLFFSSFPPQGLCTCCSCCLKDAPGLPIASPSCPGSQHQGPLLRPPEGLSHITPALCSTLFQVVPTSCHDQVPCLLLYLFSPLPVSPWGQGLAGQPRHSIPCKSTSNPRSQGAPGMPIPGTGMVPGTPPSRRGLGEGQSCPSLERINRNTPPLGKETEPFEEG